MCNTVVHVCVCQLFLNHSNTANKAFATQQSRGKEVVIQIVIKQIAKRRS